MTTEKIIDAIGMIDEKFVDEAHAPRIRRRISWVKPVAVAAAAVVCIGAPLPVMTAFGSETAYQILYVASPAVAQTFKPVRLSCTDNGVRMEVISARIDGDKAQFCIGLTDVGDIGFGGDFDLYDSYNANFGTDLVGHVSYSDFDEETKTARFIADLRSMDGSDLRSGKVTFSVDEAIYGKESGMFTLNNVDLSKVEYQSETVVPSRIAGCSDFTKDFDTESPRCLPQGKESLASPFEGIDLTGLGYADGALHIQTRYTDVFRHDDHGWWYLADGSGRRLELEDMTYRGSVSFWADGSSGSHASPQTQYVEQIIGIPFEELGDYKLCGEFYHSDGYISGDWQVTFKLE